MCRQPVTPIFVTVATNVVDLSGKFITGVVATIGSLPPTSLTPVANFQFRERWDHQCTIVDTGGKFVDGLQQHGC